MLDKLLVPRVENYAMNNSVADVEEVSQFLRKTYREYQRRQFGPFRNMVAKAIQVVQHKGGPQKPELRLQVGRGEELGGGVVCAGWAPKQGDRRPPYPEACVCMPVHPTYICPYG